MSARYSSEGDENDEKTPHPTVVLNTDSEIMNDQHQQKAEVPEPPAMVEYVPFQIPFTNLKFGKLNLKWLNFVSVGILFFINLLNYMDRFTIAAVLPDVKDFFGLNDTKAGLIQTVFVCCYMIFAPLCGYLGDRYTRKWIMTVGIVIWSVAVLFSSYVPKNRFALFAFLRGVVGIGEASYSTVAPTLLTDMFAKDMRSKMLMLYYMAIPVGRSGGTRALTIPTARVSFRLPTFRRVGHFGLGYVIGGKVAKMMDFWGWGLRVTPILAIPLLFLIIFILREPERGSADNSTAKATSYFDDLKHLIRNKSYVWSTLAMTCTVFVTGGLSWWVPSIIIYSIKIRQPQSDPKGSVSLIVGAITCAAGFIGVTVGAFSAQRWRRRNPRADPLICALGGILATPFLFFSMILIPTHLTIAWFLIALTIIMLCLNWSVIVDMLMYIVTPTRRASASAFQILMTHLFGDAFSPYFLGMVSDAIRGDRLSYTAMFYSLQQSYFVANFMLVLSALFFIFSSWFVIGDRKIAEREARAESIRHPEMIAQDESFLANTQHPMIVGGHPSVTDLGQFQQNSPPKQSENIRF